MPLTLLLLIHDTDTASCAVAAATLLLPAAAVLLSYVSGVAAAYTYDLSKYLPTYLPAALIFMWCGASYAGHFMQNTNRCNLG